jgi:hypothetical protein
MAAYFIDLDGVFFESGSMRPIAGAVEAVKYLVAHGHQIYFVTKRPRTISHPLNIDNTARTLATMGVTYTALIPNVSSPRIVINDEGAVAINHQRDSPFAVVRLSPLQVAKVNELLACSRGDSPTTSDVLRHNIFNVFVFISWAASRAADSQELLRALTVAQSLVANGGFNHRDILCRYRTPPHLLLEGTPLVFQHPQIQKAVQSRDPLYSASDGISYDIAWVAPIAAFYVNDFRAMVECVDRIVRITDASPEARLAAILAALRYRQLLVPHDTASCDNLLADFHRAISLLSLADTADFFLQRVRRTATVTKAISDPSSLLVQLATECGITHLPWGMPIAACFWSFVANDDYQQWLDLCVSDICVIMLTEHANGCHLLDGTLVTASTLLPQVQNSDFARLRSMGEYQSFTRRYRSPGDVRIPIREFFTTAFSMVAAAKGVRHIAHEIPPIIEMIASDLLDISAALVQ